LPAAGFQPAWASVARLRRQEWQRGRQGACATRWFRLCAGSPEPALRAQGYRLLASRCSPSCTMIFRRVWYPIPLRPAISRALAMSGAGKRSAICTLAVRLSRATRGDPFRRLEVPATDCRLRNFRPSSLAHQFASTSSLLNVGILVAGSFAFLICIILRSRVAPSNRVLARHPGRRPLSPEFCCCVPSERLQRDDCASSPRSTRIGPRHRLPDRKSELGPATTLPQAPSP